MSTEFLPITLISTGDNVTNCRYYPAKGSKKGIIFVGGIEGGFDSPAKNLYSKLAAKLSSEGISALRVQFRFPTLLEESVQDVLAGAKFLHSEEGVEALGLVGHSFGGAVVIQAGIVLDWVKTVVTLAAQSFGSGSVDSLAAHTSILLIHGADDETLSPTNSQIIFDKAQGHKKLEILAGNRHALDESSDGVFETIHAWLTAEL